MVVKQSQPSTCACGCGSNTTKNKNGGYRRYVRGHNLRARTSRGWIEQGYIFVSQTGKKKALHRLVVEMRDGRRLEPTDIVHHVDGDTFNNAPSNLVVLTRSEHMRLHARAKRRRWSLEERRRAVELYQTGMRLDAVARAINRPYSSTRIVIASAGQARKPHQTRALSAGVTPRVQAE